ncbi:InlB B-repeat-containing protein, partial [Cohnella fermenti]
MALCLALFFGSVQSAEAAEIEVGNWSDLNILFQTGSNDTTFKLVGEDVIESEGDLLAVPEATSYVLDLAGQQLSIITALGPAIEVPASSSLTIIDSVGGGRLTADASGAVGAAGIGGADGENGGAITIDSGTVIAKGGVDGAGIGSGACGSNCDVTGPITISGGSVEATGGSNGAGVGGGLSRSGGTITINGGNITAQGGENGAGIGGGAYADGSASAIFILDGYLEVTGGEYASGIGGGSTGDWGSITIDGGILDVTGGAMGAGIGGGAYDFGGMITINGGDVTTTGGSMENEYGTYSGAGIGGGGFGNVPSSVTITDGTVRATGVINAAAIGGGTDGGGASVDIQGGTVILSGAGGNNGSLIGAGAAVTYEPGDFGSLSNNGTITITDGGKLWIPPGETFVNSGLVDGGGEIEVSGTIVNTGTIEVDNQSGSVYVLRFEMNFVGGTNPPDITLFAATVQESGITLSEPSRTGYEFDGWYTAPSGGTKVTETDLIVEDMTLYAHWTLNSYTVTFDPNGGSFSESEVTVEHGQTIADPTEPTRVGYAFEGWFVDPADETGEWDFDGDTVSGDMTLYAHWKLNSYTVTFDPNGGSFSGSEVTVEHGQTIAEPTEPTRVGYAFEGWYVDPADETGEWDFDAAPVVEDMTLYAHWTLNSYTVTFDPNGGSFSGSEVTVEHGQTIAEPTEPTRVGYAFEGWYVDPADETGEWDFDAAPVVEDMTLYAHWKLNSYTVTFDPNGGSFSGSEVTVEHGQTIAEPTEPTRVGYAFEGWYVDPADETGGWDFDGDTVSGDMTLYAHWTLNSYTVTFDPNGGSFSGSEVTVEHGQTIAEPTEPTRVGYAFEG